MGSMDRLFTSAGFRFCVRQIGASMEAREVNDRWRTNTHQRLNEPNHMMADPIAQAGIDAKIINEFRIVFQNKGQTPPVLCAETVLDGSFGLESLDFAEVVMRLEQSLGKDPFSNGTIPELRTLGDFSALYRES